MDITGRMGDQSRDAQVGEVEADAFVVPDAAGAELEEPESQPQQNDDHQDGPTRSLAAAPRVCLVSVHWRGYLTTSRPAA